MKIKKLTPRNVAPVQRENVATVAVGDSNVDGNAIAPSYYFYYPGAMGIGSTSR